MCIVPIKIIEYIQIDRSNCLNKQDSLIIGQIFFCKSTQFLELLAKDFQGFIFLCFVSHKSFLIYAPNDIYFANVRMNFQDTKPTKATIKASAVVSGPVCGVFVPVTG